MVHLYFSRRSLIYAENEASGGCYVENMAGHLFMTVFYSIRLKYVFKKMICRSLILILPTF